MSKYFKIVTRIMCYTTAYFVGHPEPWNEYKDKSFLDYIFEEETH